MTDYPEQPDDVLALLAPAIPLWQVPATLGAFVESILLPYLVGPKGDGRVRWCRQWMEHHDAVHRLAAIHDAYLLTLAGQMTLNELYRDVIDHHVPILTATQTGVFEPCANGHKPALRLDSNAR